MDFRFHPPKCSFSPLDSRCAHVLCRKISIAPVLVSVVVSIDMVLSGGTSGRLSDYPVRVRCSAVCKHSFDQSTWSAALYKGFIPGKTKAEVSAEAGEPWLVDPQYELGLAHGDRQRRIRLPGDEPFW